MIRMLSLAPALSACAALLIWSTGLRAHEERFCCSPDRDCTTTDYETDAQGNYWVVVGKYHERVQVPPDKILQRTDNPTGRAVACWHFINGHPVVRCFVRSPES